MSSVRETWAALSQRARLVAVGLPAVLLVSVVAVAALAMGRSTPPLDETGEPEPTPMVLAPGVTPPPLPPDPSIDPNASPLPTPTPPPAAADPILGTDGRLTVLLLGSDFRPAHPGNRTDAVLVVSVEPATGATAAFSIPRDTVEFPLPGGGRYSAKVNALYQYLQGRTGDGGGAMKQAVAEAYGLEVDSYVFIGFEGFKKMIRAIGGVTVTLDRPYRDPYYWVNARTQGWGLPAGSSHLNAENALIFARSRKGDNDFGRARRQQLLIAAVVDKVRQQPEKLPRLLAIAGDTVRTDLPLASATDLFGIIATVDLAHANQIVFGPTTFADGRGGSSFAPNLTRQRAWIRDNFPAPRPFGSWPVASPAPVALGSSPATAVARIDRSRAADLE